VQEYFAFFFPELNVNSPRPVPDQEGRFAIVTKCWVRDAVGVSMLQRGFSRADEQLGAHGEIVWFWHPDAGITLATTLTRRADNGGQKARRTRENTYKP
jgi:hypothetical protein